MKNRRIELRYNVARFGLKGYIILMPDPQLMPFVFENISSSGVCLSFLSELSPEQEGRLVGLIAASQRGNYLPIQLFFNNVKIPVNAVNLNSRGKFGFCVSKHQKLTEFAEKGRQLLQMLVDAALKKGAPEADFTEHSTPGVIELNSPAVEQVPKEGEASATAPAPAEDVPKAVAPAPAPVVPAQQPAPKPSDSAVPAKPASPSTNLKDLPPKHPLVDLIKARYDAFNRKVFFLRSLGPVVAPHYINVFLPRDSEMVQVLGDNPATLKKTVFRWVPNEFNLLVGGVNKKAAVMVEDLFKQAMYLFILKKKKNDITFEEISGLFGGKLQEQYVPIRDSFFNSVLQLIDGAVQKNFAEYHSDVSVDRQKSVALKEEEQQMRNMAPEELVKKYLWSKIVELGELAQYQKETAKAWVPKEKAMQIAQLGGVVVLTSQMLDLFVETAPGQMAGDAWRDLFDEVDLRKIYERTTEVKGEKVKNTFGVFIDSLQPEFKREILMTKVINSPVWSRYYVLKKSKVHFGKVFGMKTQVMYAFIEEKMMKSTDAGGDYV
ncbi:MAG: hypothetical protein HY280_01060 [Nitrospinae bacterium]|nr:hypothetical protein [Nitrospinota bacterium]